MKFMIILTDIEGEWDRMPEAAQASVIKQHGEAEKALRAAGKFHTCAVLGPPADARTVHLRPDGKRVVSTGLNMFAKSSTPDKPQHFGAYYLIDSDSLDEALEWASKIPMVYCSMEVREVVHG